LARQTRRRAETSWGAGELDLIKKGGIKIDKEGIQNRRGDRSELKGRVDARYPEFGKLHGSNEPSYPKLHQKQAYVGWSQLFQGRLVKDWGQLQEDFIENNNETLKLDRRY
jgi:hypothetical protein